MAFSLTTITLGVNLQVPLYATYAMRDGVGVMATAIAFSFYVAGVLPVLLALGGVSDSIGRRRVMFLALLLSAAGTALMLAYPHISTLALARFVLGAGTALMSATATAYMVDLMGEGNAAVAANWVTASNSIGFGLGPALTGFCLMFSDTVRPFSFVLHLAAVAVTAMLLWRLPETAPRQAKAAPMLRLPLFTSQGRWYGWAILLCWATSGLAISVLPSVLGAHGLSGYAGLSTMLTLSCGLIFQPLARRMAPQRATRLGLLILVPGYVLLAWGATSGVLLAVLIGSVFVSSACYGLVYLGGLVGSAEAAGNEKARATAAYFLMAYVGFSVPVVFTGLVADRFGTSVALLAFGVLLTLSTAFLLVRRKRLHVAPSLDQRMAGNECGNC
ncbi:MFS transporter [Roseateles sp. DB2]|uniref:MFS transporter n=1 Tax=Roseateles sp. DB2 TaxID=3453717 RepID=UPI003EEB1ED6